MPANLENSAVATGLEKVSFHFNTRKGIAKECLNYHIIALISYTGKVMFKILQANPSMFNPSMLNPSILLVLSNM